MDEKNRWLLGDSPDPLGSRADEMRDELRQREPFDLARRTGTMYTPSGDAEGEFTFRFWNREVVMRFPDFTALEADSREEMNNFDQTMLLYYFHLSDGTSQAGKWIAFTELPDGKFYTQAYQGYTGGELSRAFGNDDDVFIQAAESLGGRREFFGNIAFSYQVLPKIAVMVVCWLGDEDFPASYNVLFDASAGHHLTTDACAILGSSLTKMLIKAKG